MMTIKSLTNIRGRDYHCRKCSAEVAVIVEKSKVVSHNYKKHTPLDQALFYCRCLSALPGATCAVLPSHNYKKHTPLDQALFYCRCISALPGATCAALPSTQEANLFQNLHPYSPGESDMEVLGCKESEQIWRERLHQEAMNFLDELLDCGLPVSFSVDHLPQLEISQHTSVPLNTIMLNYGQQGEAHQSNIQGNQRQKCTSDKSQAKHVSSRSCSCGTKDEQGNLFTGIDILRYYGKTKWDAKGKTSPNQEKIKGQSNYKEEKCRNLNDVNIRIFPSKHRILQNSMGGLKGLSASPLQPVWVSEGCVRS
ncbi:hypothetical protein ACJMK2_029826 [Sinanodonta woodiana]|uniref:C2H2-type domain-containing protein n=1 Tax=Sinanodonta woodiana TaxID=1069815 RepID=A0ABD3XCY3_SINWO